VKPAFVSAEIPLYYQLASVLRDQILSGDFAGGDRLPTEAELVTEYGVSRITVRQALQKAEAEGLIHRQVGRGTFVAKRLPSTGTIRMEGSLDNLMSMGLKTKVKVVLLQTIRATPDLAEVFRVPLGSAVTRCIRVRFHNGTPFSHVATELPDAIARRFSRNDWNGSILQVLDRKLKIPIREAKQSIAASLADASLARFLEIPIGSPLLNVHRVVLTDDGVPVQRVQTHYRSDIYFFSLHLSRTHSDAEWSLSRRTPAKRSGGNGRRNNDGLGRSIDTHVPE